jgi:TonB dependent receptor
LAPSNRKRKKGLKKAEPSAGAAARRIYAFTAFRIVTDTGGVIITPNLTVYGGYSVANPAPTPLELECSDPVRPCLIDNALVGDPNLKQVVLHTLEAGLRGLFDIAIIRPLGGASVAA